MARIEKHQDLYRMWKTELPRRPMERAITRRRIRCEGRHIVFASTSGDQKLGRIFSVPRYALNSNNRVEIKVDYVKTKI